MNPVRTSPKLFFLICGSVILAAAGCETYSERVSAQPAYGPPPPEHLVSHHIKIHAAQDFYEPLGPYGEWVHVGPHGRCWIPRQVGPGWRPYSNGYWVWTDAGWFWASDEPWAWATYHYGWWDWHPHHGWIWIPHTRWAPAWVCWRQGDGYIGWAPLPPSTRIAPGGHVDIHESAVQVHAFVFVEERRFLQPVRPATVISNTKIVNKTVNITNIHIERNVVINEGPRTDLVERSTRQKVKRVPVAEIRRQQETDFLRKKTEPGAAPTHPSGGARLQTPQQETRPTGPSDWRSKGHDHGENSDAGPHAERRRTKTLTDRPGTAVPKSVPLAPSENGTTWQAAPAKPQTRRVERSPGPAKAFKAQPHAQLPAGQSAGGKKKSHPHAKPEYSPGVKDDRQVRPGQGRPAAVAPLEQRPGGSSPVPSAKKQKKAGKYQDSEATHRKTQTQPHGSGRAHKALPVQSPKQTSGDQLEPQEEAGGHEEQGQGKHGKKKTKKKP